MTELIPSSEMPNRFPGTTTGSWAMHRFRGTGPKFVKIGRKVFYRESDVDNWLRENTYTRTDDDPKEAT